MDTEWAASRAETTTDPVGDAYMLGYATARTEETTPTTEEIRTAYVLMRSTGRAKVLGDMLAEFDRWLNTERARIRAEVAEQIAAACEREAATWATEKHPDMRNVGVKEGLQDAAHTARQAT